MLQHGTVRGDNPIGRLPSHGLRSEANLNPVALTVTTDQATRPMQSYLGAYNMSNRDYMGRPGDNTEVSVWTAPEGQRGSTNLGEDFVLITKMNLGFVTRRLLRLRVTNTRQYQWEVTEFGTHYPDGMPYRGAVRIMGSNRRKGQATIRRHGFGAMLEHGFMATERGRRHFAMVLKQMEVSWQEFLDARGLEAIISHSEFTTKWLEVNGDPGRSIRMNYVSELEKRDWAALQKRDNAYANLIKDMRNDHIQVQGDAPMLDTVIMTQSIATFHPLRAKDQVTAFINGPDVVRNVRRGVMGFSTDEFDNIVYKTGSRAVTEEGSFDPLDEQAMIGEHWKTLDARHINPTLFQPGDYDFQIYDQSRDTFVDITLEQLIVNDQRFHPNTGSVPLFKRDKPVSLDDPSLANGAGGYSPAERELDFLHIRDTTAGKQGILRPIQFWGDLGVEHISADYIVKAAQVQLNRLLDHAGINERELNGIISDAIGVIRIAASYEYDNDFENLLSASVAGSVTGIISFGKGFGRVLAYKGNVFGSVVPGNELGDRVTTDLNALGGDATGMKKKKYIFSPAHLTPGGLRTMAMSVKTDKEMYGQLFSIEDGLKVANAVDLIDKMCVALKQFNPGTATIDRQFSMPHHAVRNDADTFIETFLLEEARSVPVFHITNKTEESSGTKSLWYGPDVVLASAIREKKSVSLNEFTRFGSFDKDKNAYDNALESLKWFVLATMRFATGPRFDDLSEKVQVGYIQAFTPIYTARNINDLNNATDIALQFIQQNSETLIEGGITSNLTGGIKEEFENFDERVEAAQAYKNKGMNRKDVVDFEVKLREAAASGNLVFAPLSLSHSALKSYAIWSQANGPNFVPASQRHPASIMSIAELSEALSQSDDRFFVGMGAGNTTGGSDFESRGDYTTGGSDFESRGDYTTDESGFGSRDEDRRGTSDFDQTRKDDSYELESIDETGSSDASSSGASSSQAQIAGRVDSVFLSPKEYGTYLKSDPRHSTIVQASMINAQAVSSGRVEAPQRVGDPFTQRRQNYGDIMTQRRREAERGLKRGYEEDASLISATSRYGETEEQQQLQEELARLSKRQREVEDEYGYEYGQQTARVQTASGAITQLLHRTLSKRFSHLYYATAQAAQHSNLLRWVALTILFTPVSNTSRQAWHRFSLLPLHRWIVFRPHMRYRTSMIIMCTGDLGNTMVMPPELGIGNDVVTGMLMLTAKLSSSSVVTKHKNIIVRHHVYINALLGGSGSQFIGRDEYYSPIAGKYGRTDEHSLFACAIPMNEDFHEHLLNITGNMDYINERGQALWVSDEVRRPLTYSTAPFYNLVWHWHEARTNDLFHPGVSAKHRAYYMPCNAYTWEALGKYRRNGQIALKTTQYGHWNVRCTGEGARDLRNGGYFSESSPWFQSYARLTDCSPA